ncbi:MAG: DNA repair protein RecN [Acholeplasmataceae bacterium]
MLKRLRVENFAIIDDLDISFNHGLSVITGETGSGKSILLESLALLFGKRSDVDFIRHKEDKAVVSGDFILSNDLMKEMELPKEINLSRTIEKSGRHTIRLNDSVITLGYLRELTNKIGLIHGQNDIQLLYEKDEYLNFLDQINESESKKLLNDYLLKKLNYEEELKRFNELSLKKDKSKERIDYLTYQANELKSYNLKLNEKDELKENILKLSNFDTIKSNLSFIHNNLNSDFFNLNLLFESHQKLKELIKFDDTFSKISKTFEESYYNIDDALSEINNYLQTLDFDEETFQFSQERIFELDKIEKKYNKSVNELIIYLEEIEDELLLINNYDKYIIEAKEKLTKKRNVVNNAGLALRKLRQKHAKVLEKEIIKNLVNLDLEKSVFKVFFNEDENITLHENGIDTVDFLISFNEGEPLKPIAKVASGGEKARFMFSLKALFAKLKNLSLLVFDEIDIGISGKTAAKVSNEMKKLADDIQTIVITHLPQVAAKAFNHYNITKELIDNRVTTLVKLLTFDERILIIAGMLSDDEISSYAINQAKSLLKS